MARTKKKALNLDSSSSSSSAPSSSDDESSSSSSSSSSDEEENDRLTINSKFAKEYQERKRREELTNERQRKTRFGDDDEEGANSDSDSSESEDEDGELLTPKVDLQILKTINAIRKKDNTIYNPENKFFKDGDDGSENSDVDGGKKIKKNKPMIYKDMVRDEIMKKMDGDNNDIDDDSSEYDNDHDEMDLDDDGYGIIDKRKNLDKLAYDEEQVALRSAFLSSNGKDDEEDGLLKKKTRKQESIDEIEKNRLEELANLTTITTNDSNEDETSKIIDPKGEVENGEKFLFDFIKNKRWVDQDNFNYTGENDDGDESDSSLAGLNKMDNFESRYNFRFEEAKGDEGASSGAGLSVVGYSRSSLSDTVRRKDETRKQKRKQRKERKLLERKAKEEKLKRLKNAKKEELEGKLKQIKAVLTDQESELPNEVVDEEVVAKLMDGDFDPDKFEDLMSKMYNDDFYQQEDSDWKTDLDVKESFRKSGLQEDNEIITDIHDGGGEYQDDGEKIEEENNEILDYNDDEVDEEIEYDEYQGEDKHEYQKDEKDGNLLENQLKNRMMNELYKLDYEDIIGDMPTRFKYRKVQSNRYGLRPEEILFSRDTSLRQFVSLKKMAPYSEEEEYNPGTKKRKRFREMAKDDYEKISEADKNAAVESNVNPTSETDNGDVQTKKRRRQKKGKKNQNLKENNEALVTNDKSIEENRDNTTSKELLPEGGKGRKKKGKKIKKKESLDADNNSSHVEKSEVKKANKKKRKKEAKQESVSKSRLASYNF